MWIREESSIQDTSLFGSLAFATDSKPGSPNLLDLLSKRQARISVISRKWGLWLQVKSVNDLTLRFLVCSLATFPLPRLLAPFPHPSLLLRGTHHVKCCELGLSDRGF